MRNRYLTESKSDSVVFTFGRTNPPTIGHSKLIQTVISTAKKQGADHVIYLSQTHKPPKDPLEWSYKRRLVQAMFPGVNISGDSAIKTPFAALEELAKYYENITMVVGDDRVAEFGNKMAPYAEQWGVKNFEVVSAGARDPDADGVEGMSASKARKFAEDGDYEGFAKSLSDNLSDGVKRDVYDKIRAADGLEEDANNDSADAYRRKSLRGEFFYTGWG